jgi:hypothetical protein
MKSKLLLITALLLAGCTTTQQAQFKADLVATAPLVEAAASAAGGQYGPAAASVYGMMVAAYAGQPVVPGAGNVAIGTAVQSALPAGAQTGPVAAALLQATAGQLTAKVP